MNEMNNLQPTAAQEYQIDINITPKAFAGLARQGMLCHQGVCELCDDAIAAAGSEKARVCVALAADVDKNYLQLAVADWGCGMELSALTNALQLGSAPLTENRLNEHGFGLNKTGRSHVVLWGKEVSGVVGFLRPLGLRLPENA